MDQNKAYTIFNNETAGFRIMRYKDGEISCEIFKNLVRQRIGEIAA